MNKVELSVNCVEEVMNYLATRPWNEVNQLIYKMMAEVEESKKASEEEVKE